SVEINYKNGARKNASWFEISLDAIDCLEPDNEIIKTYRCLNGEPSLNASIKIAISWHCPEENYKNNIFKLCKIQKKLNEKRTMKESSEISKLKIKLSKLQNIPETVQILSIVLGDVKRVFRIRNESDLLLKDHFIVSKDSHKILKILLCSDNALYYGSINTSEQKNNKITLHPLATTTEHTSKNSDREEIRKLPQIHIEMAFSKVGNLKRNEKAVMKLKMSRLGLSLIKNGEELVYVCISDLFLRLSEYDKKFIFKALIGSLQIDNT
ncbi:hypothetical protein MHBO_003555, partial [Bonamia ostreae]